MVGSAVIPADSVPVAGPVVFFTGAGISVGAGLPTYRGTGGLYQDASVEPPNAEDVTPERLPSLWARFQPRLRTRDELVPSAAHLAIADLERHSPKPVTIITQNVDGLHSDAGSTRVIELHGTLRTMRCLIHQHSLPITDAHWHDQVPHCPVCGGICRPNVVLFGESLPGSAFGDAQVAIREAETIVAVGTSAVVYPAAFLIDAQHTASATCIWINPEDAPPNGHWTWLQGSADTQVARLRSL
jgi:NAD-dependent deacetylase